MKFVRLVVFILLVVVTGGAALFFAGKRNQRQQDQAAARQAQAEADARNARITQEVQGMTDAEMDTEFDRRAGHG